MLSWLPELSPVVRHPFPAIPRLNIKPSAVLRRTAMTLQTLMHQAGSCSADALALAGVMDVIHGINKPTDVLRRRAEAEAYDFIAVYTEEAAASGTAPDVLAGLRLVGDVLAAADIARKQERETGQLCSYARVEEIVGTMYAQNHN